LRGPGRLGGILARRSAGVKRAHHRAVVRYRVGRGGLIGVIAIFLRRLGFRCLV
jgi:hypothetical protein